MFFNDEVIYSIIEKLKISPVVSTDLNSFLSGVSELEEWGILYFFCLLKDKKLFVNHDDVVDIDRIKLALNILPKYAKLLECLIEILIHSGYIKAINNDIYEVSYEASVHADSLKENLDRIIKRFPEVTANAIFLKNVMDNYLSVLSGEKNFLNVLFPSGSFSVIECLYKESPDASYFNKVMACIVECYVNSYLNEYKRQASIIEVGAGVGSTSEKILPILNSGDFCSSYAYTDISKTFTRYGAYTLGDTYSFMNFFPLDINECPEVQGCREQYDVVVATNVLHTARNVKFMLKHIMSLLKPGGLLLINEGVVKNDFSTLAYGLLDGWWAFEDSKWRAKGSPIISSENWIKLLDLSGFKNIKSLNELAILKAKAFQDIIFCFKDS